MGILESIRSTSSLPVSITPSPLVDVDLLDFVPSVQESKAEVKTIETIERDPLDFIIAVAGPSWPENEIDIVFNPKSSHKERLNAVAAFHAGILADKRTGRSQFGVDLLDGIV